MMCGSKIFSGPVWTNCAVALAVRDIFPKAEVMSECIQPFGKSIQEIELPEEAVLFISTFDRLKHAPEARLGMPEISFEIDVPMEVIEKIGIDEAKEILKKSETLELVE